jgi:hypothetical protein
MLSAEKIQLHWWTRLLSIVLQKWSSDECFLHCWSMLWWMQMAILVYIFYMSKYVEFMDTVRANSCADVTFLQVKIYVRFLDMVQANSCVHVLHVKICRIHGYGKSPLLCTWYAFTCQNMLSSWIRYEPILVYSFSHVKMCWIYMDTVRANSCVVHVFTCQNVLNSWIWLDPILLCT